MTESSWELKELSLEELKALYAEGKLTREDFIKQDDYDWTLNHYIAEYNPEAFQIFQWEYKKGLITRKNFLVQSRLKSTVNHLIARYKPEEVLSIFQWEYKKGLLTGKDLLKRDNCCKKVLDYLSDENRKKVLALFEEEISPDPVRLQARLTIDNVRKVDDNDDNNYVGLLGFDSRDFSEFDEVNIKIKKEKGNNLVVEIIHNDLWEKWKSYSKEEFKILRQNMAKIEKIEQEMSNLNEDEENNND